MLFNSWLFVLLVSVTFFLYYLSKFNHLQIYILIASSIVFYAYGQPYLLILLLASVSINALASYKVYHTKRIKQKQFWATLGLFVNLAILGFFKYAGFFSQTLFSNLNELDDIGHFLVLIPLPIGISFYTFQGISLVIDVFRTNSNCHKSQLKIYNNFWKHYQYTLFFISFFPQLVAGPIVKAHDFYPQITHKLLSEVNWEKVTKCLILGYFLKMVIANNLNAQTYWISYPHFLNFSSLTLLALLFGYSIQIFADFAGYSLIAIGIAALFGYNLPTNFNFPYISRSVTEFWQRWHISLSTWLKEYLYIPLGGNRKGILRTSFNLMIVMFLGGLWHGAAWSYGIWGAWHGLALIIERPFRRSWLANLDSVIIMTLKIILTFSFVSLSWVLFKLPNFHEVIEFIKILLFNWHEDTDKIKIALVIFYSIPVILYHVLYLAKQSFLAKINLENSFAYGVMLTTILLNSGSNDAFIYFQF